MSWHFSQALVAEFSEDTCSVGELFALSSMNPTPLLFCAPDRMTAFSRLSRFGMTFAPLTADRGEELLMWFLGGFPVQTSARQTHTSAELMATPAGCGQRWRGSFARWSRSSRLWKTSQHSLFEESTEFSVTWPRWGSMRSGECFQARTPESLCAVSDSGLWRPATSGDAVGRGYHGKLDGNHWAALPGQICQFLGLPIQCPETGAIAPWVYEVLMGWPEGWTALRQLETDKFQEWQQQHLPSCQPVSVGEVAA